MKLDEILIKLNKLNISNYSYYILGSAALVIRGIKDYANDIDIAILSSDYDKLDDSIKYDKDLDFNIMDEFSSTREWLNGYQLQTLDELLRNKINKGLKKDKDTILKVEDAINKRNLYGEYMDLYDNNKNKVNEIVYREKGKKAVVPDTRYTIVVIGIIKNSENLFLIQKASKMKMGIWCIPGGHVKSGESSLFAIKEELKEEMGIKLDDEELKLVNTYKYKDSFKDVYLIEKNIYVNSLVLDEEEVEDVRYLSINEIDNLINSSMFRLHDIDIFNDIICNL